MIGWYVHHHGSGHLQRLHVVAERLTVPVTALSSLPCPASWERPWVTLPIDVGDRDDPDPTAHGALHWAPLSVAGFGERMRRIADWISRARPAVMVVDVSSEVCVLARLLGVPTVTIAMPGDRTDRAHRLAYDVSDQIVGLWPAGAHDPAPGQQGRVVPVGGISRFDGMRCASPRQAGEVLVVCGSGGEDLGRDAVAAAAAATGQKWTVRGGGWEPSADLWPELCKAETVVTFAGQNSVAEVAAAQAPAVVIAADRPHCEQRATVRAINRLDIVPALETWPTPMEWPAILQRARDRGGARWARWSTGHGADEFARVIERLAAAR